jgi:hypothetical protein
VRLGNWHFQTSETPTECPICQDSRQYIGFEGQKWTTLQELARKHRNEIREEEPSLQLAIVDAILSESETHAAPLSITTNSFILEPLMGIIVVT